MNVNGAGVRTPCTSTPQSVRRVLCRRWNRLPAAGVALLRAYLLDNRETERVWMCRKFR